MKKLTINEFITRSNLKHNYKYDYSESNYVNSNTKIKIFCKNHKDFFYQVPKDHIRGIGCQECSGFKKLTTKEFKRRAKEIHGDKYIYSKSIYIGQNKKIIIICPKHGEFKQNAKCHIIQKYGCPHCSTKKKLSKAIFIIKSFKKHGRKYKYNLVNYINNKTKVEIICKKHGSFWQTPNCHMSGQGCAKCKSDKISITNKLCKDDFLIKSINVHGNKYDYSEVVYKNSTTKVCIICPDHKSFYQKPYKHWQGNGCPSCGKLKIALSSKLTNDEFIEKSNKIHNFKYNYSDTIYKKGEDLVKIKCNTHGPFEIKALYHLLGTGCQKCVKLDKYFIGLKNFIKKAKKIHKNKYNYDAVFYSTAGAKVKIKCIKHNDYFYQTPNSHLRGQGCPFCKNKNEGLIKEILTDFDINYYHQFKIVINNKKLFVDYFLKNHNLIIEYNGKQHYEPVRFGNLTQAQAEKNFKKQQLRDEMIRNYCKENNINLLEIDGRIYKRDFLKEFMSDYLKNLLAT